MPVHVLPERSSCSIRNVGAGQSRSRGGLELVNAGHTPILLLKATMYRYLRLQTCLSGCFVRPISEHKAECRRRKHVLLYSDGITESTDESGSEYDLKRLAETLLQRKGHTPSEMVEAIHQNIVCYTNGAQPSDDRTMLALRWSPKGI